MSGNRDTNGVGPADGRGRPKPGDRLPDETDKAWRGFVTYRDLGPSRTILQAYRQETGRQAAAQPPGNWSAWAKQNRWSERAKAYDAHLDAERRKAVVAAEKKVAVKWAEIRDSQLKFDLENGRNLMKQAAYLIGFPVFSETVTVAAEDGRPIAVTYEAVDPSVLAAGAKMMKEAHGIIWAAIEVGCELEASRVRSRPRSPAAMDAGVERVKEVRARLMAMFQAKPTGPPEPGQNPYPPADPPTNGHAGGLGSGPDDGDE